MLNGISIVDGGLAVRVREVPLLTHCYIVCHLVDIAVLGFQRANTRSTAIAEGLHKDLRHFKCHKMLRQYLMAPVADTSG